jgi:hypothetical protein
MTTEDIKMWDVALRVVGEAYTKALAEDTPGWGDLEDAKRLLAFYRNTPTLVFYKQDGHWLFDGFAVLPIIEKLQGEKSRLVLETSDSVAEAIRHKFSLMRVPAPLDATEAIVRATHSLASVADKLADVLDKLATPTVSQTSTTVDD